MKRVSYEDITLAGATSRDAFAQKMSRPSGRDDCFRCRPSQCYTPVTNEFYIQ
jgi:hypothetical protein